MSALLKYGLLLLFLFSTLFYNIRYSYMVVFYSIDNQSFTETFCENKDKPELKCNGKCQMSKLAEQDPSNDKNPNYLENLQREITLFISLPASEEFIAFQNTRLPIFLYQNQYSFLFSGQIPHPPAKIS
ncbi:MAG TPA: hypothetical protein VFD29_11150 [Gillisia sp.]|nr:hypothetical protein [Gillisia sp.]